jgi:hypothetical protein
VLRRGASASSWRFEEPVEEEVERGGELVEDGGRLIVVGDEQRRLGDR